MLGSCMPQLRVASRSGFIEQVEAQVRRELLSDGNCSVNGCAQKLCTSARTLQKRLTRMGVKFSDIVQKERIEIGRAHAELQSLMRLSYAVFCLKKNKHHSNIHYSHCIVFESLLTYNSTTSP